MADTANTILLVGGGAAAVWAVSRWYKKKQREPGEAWGAEHDEDPVEVELEAAAPASAAPAGTTPTKRGLTRKHDLIFTMHGMGLPVPYLRALAAKESGLKANDPKGLINVVRPVREDFNRRHGTDIAPKDLTNPVVNVMIASDTLRRIIESYAKNHPDVENLREDWNNPHFVDLLTFGWNAGYSESSGVGRVVRHLKARGKSAVTLDDVVRAAHEADASHWLWAHPKKVTWSRSVADLYFTELGRDVRAGHMAPAASVPAQPAAQPAAEPSPVEDPARPLFDLGRPVPDGTTAIASGGWARPRENRIHRALDIPVPTGTPVLSIDDGIVVQVNAKGSGAAGIWMAVRHPSGLVSRYLHLSGVRARKGAHVRRGDEIGMSGDTGHSTGPHLHLDLRVPRALLGSVERTRGIPRSGWGPEMVPFGYSIPGETWIPLDGYAEVVTREANEQGIPLYGQTHAVPHVAATEPVSRPDQVDAAA